MAILCFYLQTRTPAVQIEVTEFLYFTASFFVYVNVVVVVVVVVVVYSIGNVNRLMEEWAYVQKTLPNALCINSHSL